MAAKKKHKVVKLARGFYHYRAFGISRHRSRWGIFNHDGDMTPANSIKQAVRIVDRWYEQKVVS